MNSEYNEETAKYIELWEQSQMEAEQLDEVSPPGFKGTVKAMKKHKEIDNPFALAWSMKNKGDKAHYKDKDGKPEKKEKYKNEDKPKKKKMGCGCDKMSCESFDSWLEGKDPELTEWLKGAINPAHKGDCTPMTKDTCTGHKKALAQRFKHGDIHKANLKKGKNKKGKG